MTGIDLEAAVKAAIKDIVALQTNEEFNKNRVAADIGEKVANDPSADVANDSLQFKRSEARLAGIKDALEVVRDYCVRGKPAEYPI